MRSLLKIPLLLLSAYCAHVSVKSPTPPAPKDEVAKYDKGGKKGDVVNWPNVAGPMVYRRIFYAIVSAEALIIALSTLAPSAHMPVPQLFHPSAPLHPAALSLSLPFLTGLACMCAGTLVRASCYRHMGRLFTFELSVKADHRLVTRGPYAVVRHPSYAGSCLFYSGACLSQLGPGSWLAESGLWRSPVGIAFGLFHAGYCVFICSFLVVRVPKEDAMMRREFKETWEEYAKRTPYRLVPFVY